MNLCSPWKIVQFTPEKNLLIHPIIRHINSLIISHVHLIDPGVHHTSPWTGPNITMKAWKTACSSILYFTYMLVNWRYSCAYCFFAGIASQSALEQRRHQQTGGPGKILCLVNICFCYMIRNRYDLKCQMSLSLTT